MNFAFDYEPGARVTFHILLQVSIGLTVLLQMNAYIVINYSRLGAYYIFS